MSEPECAPSGPVPVAFLREEVWQLLPSLHSCNSLDAVELWAEHTLLERLLYKSKSQHGSSRHFQRLISVRTALRRLRQQELATSLRRLRACLPAAGALQAATLPCAALGSLTARRLLAGTRLAAGARVTLARAAADCRSLLAASYFMPLALVGLALCARTAALLRSHLAAMAGAYNALAPLLPWLPPPLEPPGCMLPALLRCEWCNAPGGDAVVPVGELEEAERAAPLSAAAALGAVLVFEQRGAGIELGDAAGGNRSGGLIVSAERPRYALAPAGGSLGEDPAALLFGGIFG